jgi:hypothetical protein
LNQREAAARAIACFEACDDLVLLHRLLGEIAPRARKLVAGFLSRGDEDSIPEPADIRAAREAASQEEALKTLRATNDFALLQALSRAIGRRVEALEIVASAEFAEGTRVEVPERVAFPPAGRRVTGTVETTGTSLAVRLDNGERWEGPPSLARKLRA